MSQVRTQATVYDAHPAELVAAIQGGDILELGGFGAEPMPPSWLRPGLRFVAADGSPESARTEVRARSLHLRILRGLTLLMLLAAMLVTGLGIGAHTQREAVVSPPASPSWSVIAVEEDGVVLRTEGVVSMVRTGQTLPNGEQLQALIPKRNAYVTNQSTVIVSQNHDIRSTP